MGVRGYRPRASRYARRRFIDWRCRGRYLIFLQLLPPQHILAGAFGRVFVVAFFRFVQPVAAALKHPPHSKVTLPCLTAAARQHRSIQLLRRLFQQPARQPLPPPIRGNTKVHNFQEIPFPLPVVKKHIPHDLPILQQRVVMRPLVLQQLRPVLSAPAVAGGEAPTVECYDLRQVVFIQSLQQHCT